MYFLSSGLAVGFLCLLLLAGLLLFTMMTLLLCPSLLIHADIFIGFGIVLDQYQFLLLLCWSEQVVSDIVQLLPDVADLFFWSCFQCVIFLNHLLFL